MLLVVIGCAKKVAPSSSVIDEKGIYPLLPSSHHVEVGVEDDLVVVKIIDLKHSVVASHSGVSAFHRWFLYWDSSTNLLWFYSGDVGTIVWGIDDDGRVSEEVVRPGNLRLRELMPPEIAERQR